MYPHTTSQNSSNTAAHFSENLEKHKAILNGERLTYKLQQMASDPFTSPTLLNPIGFKQLVNFGNTVKKMKGGLNTNLFTFGC